MDCEDNAGVRNPDPTASCLQNVDVCGSDRGANLTADSSRYRTPKESCEQNSRFPAMAWENRERIAAAAVCQ